MDDTFFEDAMFHIRAGFAGFAALDDSATTPLPVEDLECSVVGREAWEQAQTRNWVYSDLLRNTSFDEAQEHLRAALRPGASGEDCLPVIGLVEEPRAPQVAEVPFQPWNEYRLDSPMQDTLMETEVPVKVPEQDLPLPEHAWYSQQQHLQAVALARANSMTYDEGLLQVVLQGAFVQSSQLDGPSPEIQAAEETGDTFSLSISDHEAFAFDMDSFNIGTYEAPSEALTQAPEELMPVPISPRKRSRTAFEQPEAPQPRAKRARTGASKTATSPVQTTDEKRATPAKTKKDKQQANDALRAKWGENTPSANPKRRGLQRGLKHERYMAQPCRGCNKAVEACVCRRDQAQC